MLETKEARPADPTAKNPAVQGGGHAPRRRLPRLAVRLYRLAFSTGLYTEHVFGLFGKAVKQFWYITLQELFSKLHRGLQRVSEFKMTRFGRGELSVTKTVIRTTAGLSENLHIIGVTFARQGPVRGLMMIGRLTKISAGIFWHNNRRALNYIAPAAGIVLFIFSVTFWTSNCFALEVSYNGNQLGMVTNAQEFSTAVNAVEARVSDATGTGFELKYTPSFRLVIAGNSKTTDAATLSSDIISDSACQITAGYGLYVNGTLIGMNHDGTALNSMLNSILNSKMKHTPGETVEFVQDIQIDQGLFPQSTARNVNDIKTLLTSPVKLYTAQKGDSLAGVAANFKMTTAALVALNPSLSSMPLVAGQQIAVRGSKNFLTIKILRNESHTQSVAYGQTNVDNDTMYKGTNSVKSDGVAGQALIVMSVTYIDGARVSQQMVSQTITKKPVNEVIYVGTKIKPSTASTGQFMWPIARGIGYISCPYGGYRGHSGIDIACAQGTPIMAADGGTVIFAGWDSGYGNCVIIQHSNGLQTLYGHASRLLVHAGQSVFKGQVVSLVGHTGHVIGRTGNHCHFQVQNAAGVTFNPIYYLPPFSSR
ncbi:MAG: peptidoglycan DD-metalloendopeptidase family protein [Clostridia bacterium]|nr:peptidoglycan DD-metalloendopeptidase family protein [Clostridia bacterium]